MQSDIIEQRDACADILYVVYGMADVLGIAIDDYFNNKIKNNIEYYINNNLANDFALKNKIVGNNFYNSSENISNFAKIKIIANQILGFEISSKSVSEMVDLIKSNLIKFYSELENASYIETYNNETYNNETVINKFELVANNLYELLKWTYLMTYVIGYDADTDFSIVHESNMSKLCSTEADAKATVEDYKIKYIAGTSPYDTPYYYHLPTLNKWIVKNLSTGKALKNIKYKKVCFYHNKKNTIENKRFVF